MYDAIMYDVILLLICTAGSLKLTCNTNRLICGLYIYQTDSIFRLKCGTERGSTHDTQTPVQFILV